MNTSADEDIEIDVDVVNAMLLVQRLRGLRIALWAEGDRLRYRGREEYLTSEIVDAMRRLKPQIMAVLGSPIPAILTEPPPPVSAQPTAVQGESPRALDVQWRCENRFSFHCRRWWRSVHGKVFCLNCVRPVSPAIVAAEGDWTMDPAGPGDTLR